ncbi:MAG TPA: ABC transporter ATP-binding protein [Candidatus Faecicola pullistercoris]|nr:ABC transporter ATP-binding protein [Candidatus Faecicola pullistercoris]
MSNPGMRRGPMGGRNVGGGERAKDFKQAISALIKYCGKYVPVIITAMVMAALGAVLRVIGPEFLSRITEEIEQGIVTGINMDNIAKLGVILIVLYTLSGIFGYFQSFIMATVTQKLTRKMRDDISHKVNRLPLAYFDKVTYGDVLSRVTNDVDAIGNALNMSIGQLMSAVALFLGSLIMMYVTNWILASVAVVSTLLGFVMMVLIISKSQKYFVIQQRELGLINGHIEEIYSGHEVVKAYNGENQAISYFDKINDRLFGSAWKSQFLSGLMMPLMAFIGNLGFVCVCVTGAALVLNGRIEFSVIVAFMVYVRLFAQPLSQIAQAFTSLQSAAAAGERVFEFLGEKEMEDESAKTDYLDPQDTNGNVVFKNVKFGYNPDNIIIHDFNMQAKSGQKIAIVGPTGAGKTTLVNLLMRFYELNGGSISIDGHPIDGLKRSNVHDLFGMVLQDTWLFEGTVRENIVYDKQGITDEMLDEVCKTVGIDHLVKSLPNGYDTVLNENANLSAGQKQLITIARAMIENAPLLILDEATSSVDTRTEQLIQKAMDKLTEGRTSFVIAHRLSTIKNADLILVLKDGDVVESGTHTQLLEKSGFYADLYNSQFEPA